MKTKIAVIGSNGFIGRQLIRRLLREEQVELSLFSRTEGLVFDLPCRKLQIEDPEKLAKQLGGVDLIYYLASETIPASSWDHPLHEVERNLVPFIKLLEVLERCRVKKVAFLSSAGTVYGPSSGKMKEDHDKQPFSPYGITKLSMEHFLNYARVKYQVQHDIYRVSNVYGEGQDTSKGLGLINTLIERIIRNEAIPIYGSGDNLRNYVYIGDVAELLMLSLKSNLADSGIYNLASPDTLSVKEVIALIEKVTGKKANLQKLPERRSDNTVIDLDNSVILQHFRNFQFTPIEQGIRTTYEHINSKVTSRS